MSVDGFDYDWLVIGSGFGGSVSALRLTEKGYRVGLLECGQRFEDADFAESTAQVRRYYWMPLLGLKGILRLTLFKDVFVATGCGVGGGSLGYANTLYRSRPDFAKNPQWARLADWDAELAPHYDTAEHMLGVVPYDQESSADELMKQYATEKGFGETFTQARVGVFLGDPGKTVPDPFFVGEGPERTGCIRCGSCMVGCRHNAKNTLMKNYLWFAERRGAAIMPERTVVDVRPLGEGDGSDGYAVTSVRSGRWARKDRQTMTARGVVFSAGALGTNRLLQRCKFSGALPKVSDRLGTLVRTNSESILAVTANDDTHDFARSIAITSSIYPAPDTHIEPVTYGRNGDTQSLILSLATVAGSRGTRPFFFLLNVLRHPRNFLRSMRVRKWSGRTVILLVMQTVENSIMLRVKFRLPGGFPVLTTKQDPDNPIPDSVPAAYEAGAWLAERIGGIVQAATPEAVLSIPSTAHLLGGAVIGETPETGVINARQEVFGYQSLLVCDGSAIPANVGVNPSLTITAMTERAMAFIEPKPGAPLPAPISFTAST
ncbi:MAG TPA: GMC family oxidoreductase [Pseudonocardia sp.]|jgi:cholesterol oxidase|uniref:GMC family oxidoreductase n=1 Tax=Pseudonocardia sp. TaxID=60912 RepID=UPI002BE9BCA4|nr:GMC family oxidoreductase [Pseudonocardia sp.]HTF53306.1 GMC family oxidoreductase [Pseudonocardia sp.]